MAWTKFEGNFDISRVIYDVELYRIYRFYFWESQSGIDNAISYPQKISILIRVYYFDEQFADFFEEFAASKLIRVDLIFCVDLAVSFDEA